MDFREVRRRDQRKLASKPRILLTPEVISYNQRFIREANLDRRTRVTMHIDDEDYRLGLEFHRNPDRENSFRVCWPRQTDRRRRNSGVTSSIAGLVSRCAWLRRVATLREPDARRFRPLREGVLWVVQLGPTFEHEATRNVDAIPPDAVGIYRYLRPATDEVVYIGRGRIANRLRSPERAEWDFDRIQYSLIDDVAEQTRWERHWLEEHRKVHGKLPEYNRI